MKKTYRITETTHYEVKAKSADEAESLYLQAGSVTRDTTMFVEVADREVYEKESEGFTARELRQRITRQCTGGKATV
jgi:hypothetical protein